MANLRNSTVNGQNLCSNALLNTAFGYGALYNHTAGCGCNTGIGAGASSPATGKLNTSIGNNAYTAGYGTAIGQNAQSGGGGGSVAIGAGAGSIYASSTNIGAGPGSCRYSCNTVTIGHNAGAYMGAGTTKNVIIGSQAAYTNPGQNFNCSVILGACAAIAVGDCSVIGGYRAGRYIGNAVNNILIGYAASQRNGYGVNNQAVLGTKNNNVYNCVYTAWTDVSDCRDKTNLQPLNNLGLNFLRKLNPVKYKWDLRQKYEDKCGYEYGIKDGTLKQDDTNYGFLAQEIEFAAKSLGENFDAVTHDTFIDQYSLNYLNLIATLTKALQEINDDLDLIETQLNS